MKKLLIAAIWLGLMGAADAATITQKINCYQSLVGPEPSDVEIVMNVGDTVQFVPISGGCQLYYAPPAGFTQNVFTGGWSFTATSSFTSYPYAYFMLAGSSGRFVTYSVVVY